jgi:hypothetical protein
MQVSVFGRFSTGLDVGKRRFAVTHCYHAEVGYAATAVLEFFELTAPKLSLAGRYPQAAKS